jgi:hypothetical protein
MDIVYLSSELKRVRPQILDIVRDELQAYNGVLIPTTGNLAPGEEGIVNWARDYTGRSARYNGISTDIPTVNISLTSHEYRVGTWVIGAEWTQHELYRERIANLNSSINRRSVVQTKMAAMQQIIAEGIDKALIYGDVRFDGLVNNSNVPLQVESVAPYTLTPTALYEYFRGVVEEFKRSSRLRSSQISLVVPPDLYSRLTRTIDTVNSITPFSLLTNPTTGQSVAEILELDALDSAMLEAAGVQAVGTNRDRFMLYHRNPDTISRETYPIITTTPLPLPDGLHFMCSGYQGTTEVMVKQPMRIRYYSIAQPA